MARKQNRVSHGKEVFYIVCILVLLLVVLAGYFGPGGYRDLRESQKELQIHRAQLEALNRDSAKLSHSILLLRTDKQAQENFARQKGYAGYR